MKLSISLFWRKKKSYYEIKITKCKDCGSKSFFERSHCPVCGGSNVETIKSSGKGTIRLYTISYYRTEGSEEDQPRIIALIDLDEGITTIGEVVDVRPSEIKEGMRVEAVLRRLTSDDPYGLIYYGLKFRPITK
jgi:hypothetical protein